MGRAGAAAGPLVLVVLVVLVAVVELELVQELTAALLCYSAAVMAPLQQGAGTLILLWRVALELSTARHHL